MDQTFNAAAKEAKAKGYIKDYVVVNGDGTQNQQIAQMNSLILKGVDAICMNAASTKSGISSIKTPGYGRAWHHCCSGSPLG